jgi:hypothetical protein
MQSSDDVAGLVERLDAVNRSVFLGPLATRKLHDDAAATITRLQGEIERLRNDYAELLGHNQTLTFQVVDQQIALAKAEAALEPIDDALGEDEPDYPDGCVVQIHFGAITDYTLKLGDFRRVRATLAEIDALKTKEV